MIEVFKTNVIGPEEATLLIDEITKVYADYTVNFDLEDCDRIMRVETLNITIDSENIIVLLRTFGFSAAILEDEIGLVL